MKLKPYPAYKESGVKWLGQVPNAWVVGSIRHNLDKVFNGQTATQIDEDENTVPVTRIETISIGVINEARLGFISKDDARNDMKLQKGDILFSNINSLSMIGNCAQYNEDRVIYAGMNLLTLRPAININKKWAFWVVRSNLFRQVVEALAKPSINQASISQSSLMSIVIATPSLNEQIKISNFLDRETGKLDTLISKQEQLIDRFNERIIATVMGALLSTDTQYIRLVHVCEVISRPVNQSSENAFTRLGVLNRGRGLFKREETDSEDMGDSDFFWVKNGDLVLSGQFAWEGSVAMANDEHEGCVVSHRFPIIKGKAGIVLTEYLLALFMTSHGDFLLNENSRGSAGRNRPLNMSLLLKEKIPIASMAIQNKVANLLRLQKKLKDKASIQIDLLKEHRTALISAAVTGKIDVREAA